MTNDNRRQLQDAASRQSPDPDVDQLWQQANAKRNRRLVAVVAAVTVAVVTAPALIAGAPRSVRLANQPGADDVPDEVRAKQPPRFQEPTRKGNITVRPDPAAPGQIVELHFSADTSRSVMFVLQKSSEAGSWVDVAYMYTDYSGEPGTYTVEEAPSNLSVPQPAKDPSQPDRVQLPENLAAGSYRVCDSHAPDFCADLRVSASGS